MTRKVHVRIDHLALDGVGVADRAAFERALKQRLTEALGRQHQAGALRGGVSVPRLDGGELASPADPGALAQRLASAVLARRVQLPFAPFAPVGLVASGR